MSTTATAYHEAGHAAVALHLGVPFESVSIEPHPEGDYNGCVAYGMEPDWLLRLGAMDPETGEEITATPEQREWLKQHILCSLAGHMAEEQRTGKPNPHGASDDHAQAAAYARHIHPGGPVLQAYLDYLAVWARQLLASPPVWQAVEAIAAALLTQGTLTHEQAGEVYERARWARPGPSPAA